MMNNEDAANVKEKENLNLNLCLLDDDEPLEEINLYFEHFRIETLCHYLNSGKNSPFTLTLSNSDSSSQNSDSYYNEQRNKANSTIPSNNTINNTEKQPDTDEKYQPKVLEHFAENNINDNYSQINEQDSKLRYLFKPKLPYRFSTTTNDLHSLLKKLSCLKRVYSAVDINHNPTNHFNHRSRFQTAKQNGHRKPLTKSDIVHLQQFKVDQPQSPVTTITQPVNVPKLCIEVQY